MIPKVLISFFFLAGVSARWSCGNRRTATAEVAEGPRPETRSSKLKCHCECMIGGDLTLYDGLTEPKAGCACMCDDEIEEKELVKLIARNQHQDEPTNQTNWCRCECENGAHVFDGVDRMPDCDCQCELLKEQQSPVPLIEGGVLPEFTDDIEESNETASCGGVELWNNPESEMAEKRSGVGFNLRWIGTVPVILDTRLNPNQRNTISNVLNEFNSKWLAGRLQVVLVTANNAPAQHVLITTGRRQGNANEWCWAFVGRGGGQTVMNMAPACFSQATIRHEFIHVLGYHHEQSRPDRQRYVRIVTANIIQGNAHNFAIAPNTNTYGVSYDYRSIMHYPPYSFSRNGGPTIIALGGQTIQSSHDLTSLDQAKLNALYPRSGIPIITTTTTTTTTTGGTRATIIRSQVVTNSRFWRGWQDCFGPDRVSAVFTAYLAAQYLDVVLICRNMNTQAAVGRLKKNPQSTTTWGTCFRGRVNGVTIMRARNGHIVGVRINCRDGQFGGETTYATALDGVASATTHRMQCATAHYICGHNLGFEQNGSGPNNLDIKCCII